MLFVVGGSMAFFFSMLLLGKKPKSLADKILSSWMFCVGIHLFMFYFSYTEFDMKHPHLLGLAGPLPFVHGPFLYLYSAALTQKLENWNKRILLHFIPVALFYLIYSEILFTYSGQEKIAFVEAVKAGETRWPLPLFLPAMIISAVSYMHLTRKLYFQHQQNIQQQLSFDTASVNLHWLRNLMIGLSSVWTVVIIINITGANSQTDQVIFISVVLFVAFIGYYGIRQGDIFASPGLPPTPDKEPDSVRYQKSGLKDHDIERIESSLVQLMAEHKVFLRETLSLPQLAKELNTHSTYLSQVINDRFKQNFYDFVNTYRIEEFKTLVDDPNNRALTIAALAQDCGFASKASFNKSFKKFNQQTPSEYISTLPN